MIGTNWGSGWPMSLMRRHLLFRLWVRVPAEQLMIAELRLYKNQPKKNNNKKQDVLCIESPCVGVGR